MATENGERPATQGDIKKLDVKIDGVAADNKRLEAKVDAGFNRLDAKIDRVALALVKTREEMATKADFVGLSQRLDHVVSVVESNTAELANISRTIVVWDKILAVHQATLGSHDSRLTALEARPGV